MPAVIHYRAQLGAALVFGTCQHGDGFLGDEAAARLRLAGHLPLPERRDVVSVRLDTTVIPQYDFFQWGAGYRPYRLESRCGAFEPVEMLVEVLPTPPAPPLPPQQNPYATSLLRRAREADSGALEAVAARCGHGDWAALCAALAFAPAPGGEWAAHCGDLAVALSSPAGDFPGDPWAFRLLVQSGGLKIYDALIVDGEAR